MSKTKCSSVTARAAALSATVLLLAGCSEGPGPYDIIPAEPPSIARLTELVGKSTDPEFQGRMNCLYDKFPVTVSLTEPSDRGLLESQKPPVPDLEVVRALETLGLVKSRRIREKAEAYNMNTTVDSVRFELTPAAAPWTVSADGADGEVQLCFGKSVRATDAIQLQPVQLKGKAKPVFAWKQRDNAWVRTYATLTFKPQPAFSEVETAIRNAAHLPSAKKPDDAVDKAFAFIRSASRSEAYESTAFAQRKGTADWRLVDNDEAWVLWFNGDDVRLAASAGR